MSLFARLFKHRDRVNIVKPDGTRAIGMVTEDGKAVKTAADKIEYPLFDEEGNVRPGTIKHSRFLYDKDPE